MITIVLVAIGFAGLIYFAFKLMGIASDRSSTKSTASIVNTNAQRLQRERTGANRAFTFDGSAQKLARLVTKKETTWSKIEAFFGEVKNDPASQKDSPGATNSPASSSASSLITVVGEDANATTVAQAATKLSDYSTGHRKLWRSGSIIKVAFIDGNFDQRTVVELSAVEWSQYANLKFDFESSVWNSDIRISFQADQGDWSYIGTDAKDVENPIATMNFDPTLQENINPAVVLNQFGYAIGLLDEQHNPYANIPWNQEAVYEAFSELPKLWTNEKIVKFLIKRWPEGSYPSDKPYDGDSIMHSSVPNDLTLGNFEVKAGSVLSVGDKEWARALYP